MGKIFKKSTLGRNLVMLEKGVLYDITTRIGMIGKGEGWAMGSSLYTRKGI